MRTLIVAEHISLDGVVQGPGGPKEDASGGFRFGGWSAPFDDDAIGQFVQDLHARPFELLLARFTYDIWAAVLAAHTGRLSRPRHRGSVQWGGQARGHASIRDAGVAEQPCAEGQHGRRGARAESTGRRRPVDVGKPRYDAPIAGRGPRGRSSTYYLSRRPSPWRNPPERPAVCCSPATCAAVKSARGRLKKVRNEEHGNRNAFAVR